LKNIDEFYYKQSAVVAIIVNTETSSKAVKAANETFSPVS